MKPRILRCDEGHGRLPWLGHVRCDTCGKDYKRKPALCRSLRVGASGHLVVCGSQSFTDICAKCFASDAQSDAHRSFDMQGELAVPGRGAPLE